MFGCWSSWRRSRSLKTLFTLLCWKRNNKPDWDYLGDVVLVKDLYCIGLSRTFLDPAVDLAEGSLSKNSLNIKVFDRHFHAAL